MARTPALEGLEVVLRSIFSCASASMDCKADLHLGEVGLAQQPGRFRVMPSPARSSPK